MIQYRLILEQLDSKTGLLTATPVVKVAPDLAVAMAEVLNARNQDRQTSEEVVADLLHNWLALLAPDEDGLWEGRDEAIVAFMGAARDVSRGWAKFRAKQIGNESGDTETASAAPWN